MSKVDFDLRIARKFLSLEERARSKGLTERKVLYGHVFRNAMFIVIAGFP